MVCFGPLFLKGVTGLKVQTQVKLKVNREAQDFLKTFQLDFKSFTLIIDRKTI